MFEMKVPWFLVGGVSGQSPDGLGDRRSVVGKGDRETRE